MGKFGDNNVLGQKKIGKFAIIACMAKWKRKWTKKLEIWYSNLGRYKVKTILGLIWNPGRIESGRGHFVHLQGENQQQ